ncbi:MAG: hypothetical protein LBJ64_04310, partial [Deltaproteobacteria bacterium]|nr:hypothetical protein [Deltaproteobacteria bacterium]
VALLLRRLWHKAARHQVVSSREKAFRPRQAAPGRQWVIVSLCSAAALLGFVLPAAQMLYQGKSVKRYFSTKETNIIF